MTAREIIKRLRFEAEREVSFEKEFQETASTLEDKSFHRGRAEAFQGILTSLRGLEIKYGETLK